MLSSITAITFVLLVLPERHYEFWAKCEAKHTVHMYFVQSEDSVLIFDSWFIFELFKILQLWTLPIKSLSLNRCITCSTTIWSRVYCIYNLHTVQYTSILYTIYNWILNMALRLIAKPIRQRTLNMDIGGEKDTFLWFIVDFRYSLSRVLTPSKREHALRRDRIKLDALLQYFICKIYMYIDARARQTTRQAAWRGASDVESLSIAHAELREWTIAVM